MSLTSNIMVQLSDNLLSTLPSTLGELTCLQRLNLSHNQLQELPAGAYILPDLRSLQLDHNNFSSLPDDLGNLPVLEYLVICYLYVCLLIEVEKMHLYIMLMTCWLYCKSVNMTKEFQYFTENNLFHIMLNHLKSKVIPGGLSTYICCFFLPNI